MTLTSALTGIICVGTDMTEQVSSGEERISTRAYDRILSFTDISPEAFDAVNSGMYRNRREGREGKTSEPPFLSAIQKKYEAIPSVDIKSVLRPSS